MTKQKTPSKVCIKCGEEKPLTDYYKSKRNKDGRRGSCISCYKKYGAFWYRNYYEEYKAKNIETIKERDRHRGPEKRAKAGDYHREYNLRKNYGMTIEDYDNLLESQGGGCAICGKTEDPKGRRLPVDHDHKTGKVRGILCTFCNHRLVGRHRDSKLLRAAADYLDRPGTNFTAPKKSRKRKR